MSENQVVTLSTSSELMPTLVQDASKFTTWANGLIIATPEEFDATSLKLAVLDELLKKAEADKERLYRPIKTALDAVSTEFKPLLDDLANAKAMVRRKMTQHITAEQEKARVAEEKARKEREEAALAERKEAERIAAEEQARIKKEAEEKAAALRAAGDETMAAAVEAQGTAGVEAIAAAHNEATNERFEAASTQQPVLRTHLTSAGAFQVRKIWDYELVDIKLVPAQFLELNSGAVREAVNGGTRDVPGLRIFQKDSGGLVKAKAAA